MIDSVSPAIVIPPVLVTRMSRSRSSLATAWLALCVAAAAMSGQSPALVPGPSLGERRSSHTATVLADGRLLIAGGLSGNTALASVLLVDPATGAVRSTGSLQTARGRHTATLLKDGRVLIAGGVVVSGTTSTPIDSAEIYDPASGQFTSVGSMTMARAHHAAAGLPDGRVLICGGAGAAPPGGVTPLHVTAEVFDPATGRFTAAGNMMTTRSGHTATLLDTGQVLVTSQGTAELFDAATSRFTRTGNPNQPRSGDTATLLRDGRVLLVGGLAANLSLTAAELYDPRTATFQVTDSLATSRHGHTATLLPDGRVLVAGGWMMTKSAPGDARPYTSSPTATAEMYDPVAGTFTATASLAAARGAHVAALTGNGVWITGGIGTVGLDSSEVFGATTPLGQRPAANVAPKPAPSAPREARQYTDRNQRWSITYPRDWRLEDRAVDYVRITSPGDPAGIVGIHTVLFDRERLSIDDFAATVMAGESHRPGFKIQSRRRITLADGTAALEIVNMLGVKPAGKSRKIFIIAGHRGFAVNAETFLDAWPAFDAAFDLVIASFTASPPTWQSRLEDAQQLAVDGFAYSLTTPTGVVVFQNNARPVCHTYSIPGDWVAAAEPSAWRSPQGKAFIGFLAIRDEDLRQYSGRTSAERALNGITRRYEEGLRQTLNAQILPFEAARPGAWKWTAAPLKQKDREIVPSAKYVVDLERNAVAEITISGTADDDGLARQIIGSLKTTTARGCYWPDLERLLKSGGSARPSGTGAARSDRREPLER
jgi:hypothetical protein